MGDMGDVFRDLTKHKKEKREENTRSSTEVLRSQGIVFESKNNGAHLIVGDFDFWPSTGLFIHRKTKKKGRGVFNLIEKVNSYQPRHKANRT